MTRMLSAATAPLLALLLVAPGAKSLPSRDTMNAAEVALALRKLGSLGSVLYVAAHPDDENTSLLAYLEGERCIRAGYLAITRGDGGQNLIGAEKGELMGLLRTQELLAARRIDGAEQLFTRAIDFGYSKSAEESLAIWGHDAVLGDVVWAFRSFRPDVVVTRFPKSGAGGHGHHTASAILAEEAFAAAGDPSRYPEQLAFVKPWKPKRIVWNSWQPQFEKNADTSKLLRLDLGAFNALLGKSYTEIAGESRSQHKSQGFGAPERRGSRLDYFEVVAGEPAASDPLEGVETSWSRVKGGEAVGATIQEAVRTFDAANPERVLPLLLKAHAQLAALGDDPWVEIKRRDLLDAIRGAAGLWVEAVATTSSASPEETVTVNTSVINRSSVPMTLERVELTHGKDAKTDPQALDRNQPLNASLAIALPADAPFTGPYWLQKPPTKGLFVADDPRLIGLPEAPPPLRATFTIRAGDERLTFETPVVFRWVDPVKGEQTRPFEIAPRVTIDLGARVLLFPSRQAKEVRATVRAVAASASGTLRLMAPSGWRIEPASQPFALKARDEDATLSFQVTPPDGATTGVLAGEAEVGGVKTSRGVVRVNYPHIPIQTLFPPAEAKLVRSDVAHKGKSIGYVAGPGDDVAESIAQLGYEVTPLNDDDLDRADLERFDAIVTGVRAYNTRARLKTAQKRLMRFVEKGGTLVLQYNTLQELVTKSLGPYPFEISRDRVTVEEAPVKLLAPKHSLLTTPNAITDADFAGWVQERGLYFPGTWDSHYETVLATADPGESEKQGSVLYAPYGKGVYVYTALAFFRQLPAGVPGAYRLFANMLSARLVHD